MLKFATIILISFSFFIFSCGNSKTTSEKVESPAEIQPDTSISSGVDSLLQRLDQTAKELKRDAEDTKKAVDELLKEF